VKATIHYGAVPMVCEFAYYKGFAETRVEPGEPESVTLESCRVGGVEINDMLTDLQWEEIEGLLLNWCSEEREYQD
jgi:hypothetical protein